MNPEDFFSFDPEKGEWRNKATGNRFVMLGEPFYINMIINLTKQFGSAAGVFVYQSGLGVGQEMGHLVLNAPDALMGIKTLFKNIFTAGWGAMRLENEDLSLLLSNEPVTILESNGFYSFLSQSDGAEHLKPFVKGVLIGIFDTLRRKEHTCEMEIISEDPLMCRYIVQPLS
ncbi:hypothetical protein KQH65_11230 [archaeon]|nr:hypothetical protein [archaeon]